MERLTRKTRAGVGILRNCTGCPFAPHCPGTCVDQDKANTRLAEYEDTGLSPQEVEELKAENREMRGRLERIHIAAMP